MNVCVYRHTYTVNNSGELCVKFLIFLILRQGRLLNELRTWELCIPVFSPLADPHAHS